MCNTLINRLHDRRLYIIAYIVVIFLGVVFNQALILIMTATVTAVVFMPTRRLGLMGRLFITLSVYIRLILYWLLYHGYSRCRCQYGSLPGLSVHLV